MSYFAEADNAVGLDGSSNDRLVDDGCIHLLSMGSKVLMMQIWICMTTGRLIFRYLSFYVFVKVYLNLKHKINNAAHLSLVEVAGIVFFSQTFSFILNL